MKARIEQIARREVSLTDPDGKITVYWIPHTSGGRGYVRTRTNNPLQVCEQLANTGKTLTATPETLITIIRREWQRKRRYEKKIGLI